MSDLRAAPDQPEPLAGWRWWTGLSAGAAVGLFGLAGLAVDAAKTMPLVWLRWLIGLLLVHDFVLAPMVHLTGRRLRDRSPESWRWPLQLGLVTSGVLVLASVPVLVGVGRRTQPGNTSVLPGNYPLALAAVLTLVWLGVLALGIRGSTRGRRHVRRPRPLDRLGSPVGRALSAGGLPRGCGPGAEREGGQGRRRPREPGPGQPPAGG